MAEQHAERPNDKAADLPLERFREYLHLLARSNLGRQYQGKLDASDVVQQTLLHAHREQNLFHGTNDAELAGWLRQILAWNLGAAFRALGQQKRDVSRERAIQADLDQSSARLENFLTADVSSPSHRAARGEQILRIAQALGQLPDDQREATVLRHCRGLSLEEICKQMDKSERAVSSLLFRATKQLKQSLLDGSEGQAS